MRASYRIRCTTDGREFDTMEELCEFYHMTKDQVYYRLDKPKDYHDGMNFARIIDNTEALESLEKVDTSAFIEKFGEKEVDLPGYEGKYTINTHGQIKNNRNFGRIIPVKTKVTVKHSVILHSIDNKQTQTHSLMNLMKKAFGDPDAQ